MNILSSKTTPIRYKSLFLMAFLGLFLSSTTQIKAQAGLPPLDSVEMLIQTDAIQWECTQAINSMYNFDFGYAESIFRYVKRTYPEHPIGYFLMGLSYWWRIAPNIDTRTQYDERFFAYMDSSILYAEEILDREPENSPKYIEAAFFLAGSHGFEGRLLAERKQWTKSAFSGKRALKYLEIAEGRGDLSPELLFGDGLYNYYSIWIPENYKYLKPLLWFFRKGDKEKGLEQLVTVSRNAFYSRTEAEIFLMKIHSQEGEPQKSYMIGKRLTETYPNNPYIQRYHARILYQTGRLQELEKVSLDIIAKVDSAQYGYEALSGRYATYYLGYINWKLNKKEELAKEYFERSVTFSEEIGMEEAGYYLLSLDYLGSYHEKKGDYEKAKVCYEKIKDNADRKDRVHEKARDFLKRYRKEYKD
ncbi:MAG: tol-pal system protein YbgF [Bacteroidota bacterium]